MKTIYYRCESRNARAYAMQYGLPYQGKERLNCIHVGDEPGGLPYALLLIEEIRQESDFFEGHVELGGNRQHGLINQLNLLEPVA